MVENSPPLYGFCLVDPKLSTLVMIKVSTRQTHRCLFSWRNAGRYGKSVSVEVCGRKYETNGFDKLLNWL